jgi:predicted Zn-dependent protease
MMQKIFATIGLAGCVTIACAQDAPNFLKNLIRQIPGAAQPQTGQPSQKPQAQPGLFADTSIEEEVAIGRQLAGDLLGAVPLVKDDKLQVYVNRVGRWVATQSDRPELNWYFGILDSNDINAFALPGGYVFVTKGLYAKLANEAELAGVLGHEVGHVMLKHHLKVLKQSQLLDQVKGFAAQQLAKGGSNALAQNVLGNGAEALARGLDKDAEYEADRVGVVLATRAGYDPYALPTVLQKIAQVNPGEASLALLYKTHPLPQDRLIKLGEAMGDSFDKYGDGKTLVGRLQQAGR